MKPSTPITIDGHMIGTQETGNETYVVQLAAALGQLGGYHYNLLATHPSALPPELTSAPYLSIEPLADMPSALRIPFLIPTRALRSNAGLLHMTYVAPPISPCPVVLSVHDVSYRIFPEFFSPRVRLVLGMLVGPSVRRAARVITISHASKRDIVRFCRVPARRVVVTPLAAGPQYTPQSSEEIERVRASLHLDGPYILAVGNVQPRKNLPRLVQAFAKIAPEHPDLLLVIGGRSTWGGSDVERLIASLGLERRVRFTGYVPGSDLPALYAGALVFCYPSLYEGFGLPPLEAMSCGTPTITSNVSSLPEVVGGAALTVDPTSVAEIAAALRYFASDGHEREVYSRKGLERARQFSWEKTARLTRDVYSSVLSPVRRDAAAGGS